MDREHLEAYWAKNLSLIRNLLVVWAVVAYVLGILLAPALNGIRLFGGPPWASGSPSRGASTSSSSSSSTTPAAWRPWTGSTALRTRRNAHER